MGPPLQISIPTASVNRDSKPYTAYAVKLQQPLRVYTISKRYSDFTVLHSSILSQCDNKPPPAPLPQKSWFKSTISDPTLTEERRRGLEEYLSAINEARDPRWRNSNAWKDFLKLPPGGGNSMRGVGAASSLRNSEMGISIKDPTAWLDLHRDVKTQLRDARLGITRKEQANTAHAQHEAGSEVKRCLVKASTMISALDQGLKSMGHDHSSVEKGNPRGEINDDYVPRLGEGEVRRRRDLLAAARNELSGLESLLTSSSAKSSSVNSASATTDDMDSLLNGANRRSSAGPMSRRVIGGPAKETERTRELDNTGVLQLQQQIIQEQDQDVSELTTVVQRMKEMGVQINNELELQNQMLGMLDQDVERVGDKVNVAKKRIAKIK